jgi:hypothetical protein
MLRNMFKDIPYSYLKQAKISFFFLLQNWRTGGQHRSCLGVGVAPLGGGGGGERVTEGDDGANAVLHV